MCLSSFIIIIAYFWEVSQRWVSYTCINDLYFLFCWTVCVLCPYIGTVYMLTTVQSALKSCVFMPSSFLTSQDCFVCSGILGFHTNLEMHDHFFKLVIDIFILVILSSFVVLGFEKIVAMLTFPNHNCQKFYIFFCVEFDSFLELYNFNCGYYLFYWFNLQISSNYCEWDSFLVFYFSKLTVVKNVPNFCIFILCHKTCF